VRNRHFKQKCASTTVVVNRLPVKDAQIELDLISVVTDGPYRCEAVNTDRAPAPAAGRYPQAVKAGPYIFTAGQIPTDFVHTVAPPAQVDPRFPFFGRSIKRQAAYILDNIGAVLEAAGSSLDHIVKAIIFLADSRDFQGLDEVWRDYFPTDPPARTVAPATTLFPGGRLEIQTIAVTSAGPVKREVVVTDRAPHPTIHQSQAIKAGDLVFLSGLMATDYESPIAPAARVNPAFPNHAVGMRRQTEYILDTAEAILEAAGSSLGQLVRWQSYLTDFDELPVFQEAARARLDATAPAGTMVETVGELIVPDCRLLIDATAVVPGA
jgi:reactive intermediate/imine deaminase